MAACILATQQGGYSCRHEGASQAATSELRQLLDLSAEHVCALRLQQFPYHLALAIILEGLPSSIGNPQRTCKYVVFVVMRVHEVRQPAYNRNNAQL